MSADTLRRAAKVLREHAEKATKGPWNRAADHEMASGQYPDNAVGYWDGEYAACVSYSGTGVGEEADRDARYMTLMHPPVALALAVVLNDWADQLERRAAIGMEATEVATSLIAHAVNLAHAILREQEDGAP